MQSCSFQHLLAGQVETNAAKTFQHIFKSQPRTNPEEVKHVFKMKHLLSLNAACRNARQGVSSLGSGGHVVADACGMCRAFASGPSPGQGLLSLNLQWPGISTPEGQCAWDPSEQATWFLVSAECSGPGTAAALTVMKVLSVGRLPGDQQDLQDFAISSAWCWERLLPAPAPSPSTSGTSTSSAHVAPFIALSKLHCVFRSPPNF